MPNSLRLPKIISRTRRIAQANDIPFLGGYADEYYKASNWLINHHRSLINKMLEKAGKDLIFPIETTVIEASLTGFRFNYIPFNNSDPNAPKVEGWWEWDNKNFGVVNIFYNSNCNPERQLFTKVHESFHVCQSLDSELLSYLDYLITSSTLPRELVLKLLERATNKATAMYLMPNKQFVDKYKEAKSLPELANYFKVSLQALTYRLKEVGLPTTF